MKLYVKILLFIVSLMGAALWANIHFSRVAVSEAMSAQITDSAASASADLADEFRAVFVSGKELDGIKALHALTQRTGAVYAGMVSRSGDIIAHTNVALAGTRLEDPLLIKGTRATAPVFRRITHNGEEVVDALLPVQQRRPSGEDLLFEGLNGDAPVAGFLRVGLPLTPARKAEKAIIFNLLLLALLIAAAAALLSALFARLLLRQVAMLGEGIRKVRGGDYNVSVPVIAQDELGDVAQSFNKLSQGLSETTVSKQYLDSVLESMPDPLIITDEAGLILKANKAAADLSGYDFKTGPQLNLKDLLEPQAAGAAEPLALLSWSGHIKELDLWLKASDGRRLPAMLSAGFIGGGGGRRQVVTILKDMAQHRESEARMAQYLKEVETVNSELDSFAHTVSHDLKEPLRGIEMFTGMLLSDYAAKMEPQAADYLGRVVKASARMRRLIDDLLGYARVARVRNPYESASTAKLASEAVAGLGALIEESKALVHVSRDLPEIYCDPVKMRQLFQNLVSNAIKYNESPVPEVSVTAEKFGEYYWKFCVKDNGIGIPSQYYEEIFKMFKRLHARQEHGGGTGAGLAIVKKIAEEHNGKIWVESEEGKGSAFYALIPADLRKKP